MEGKINTRNYKMDVDDTDIDNNMEMENEDTGEFFDSPFKWFNKSRKINLNTVRDIERVKLVENGETVYIPKINFSNNENIVLNDVRIKNEEDFTMYVDIMTNSVYDYFEYEECVNSKF